MKKSLIALTLISSLGLGSIALAAPDAELVKQRVEQLKTEFNLDAAQAQRITSAITNAPPSDEDLKAQRDARFADHLENRLNKMKTALGLNDDQVAQLKTIMTEQRTKAETIRAETQTRINSVLTPEQAEKMKNLRGGVGMDRDHEGKGRHGHGRHHGDFDGQEGGKPF